MIIDFHNHFYPAAYLDALLPKLERGAMIVCDNLLWGGRVAEGIPAPEHRECRRPAARSPQATPCASPRRPGRPRR